MLMWAYDSLADRERRRAAMYEDPDWQAFISGIIIFANLVYCGFFGVLAAVAVYLSGVELVGLDLRWLYAPIVISIGIALTHSVRNLTDYWRNHGHG